MSDQGDIRQLLNEKFSNMDRVTVDGLIDAVLGANTMASFECRKCGLVNKTEVADVVKRAKALEILANQAKGTPKQTLEVQVPGSREELWELDAEQLKRIAAGAE